MHIKYVLWPLKKLSRTKNCDELTFAMVFWKLFLQCTRVGSPSCIHCILMWLYITPGVIECQKFSVILQHHTIRFCIFSIGQQILKPTGIQQYLYHEWCHYLWINDTHHHSIWFHYLLNIREDCWSIAPIDYWQFYLKSITVDLFLNCIFVQKEYSGRKTQLWGKGFRFYVQCQKKIPISANKDNSISDLVTNSLTH